MQPPSAGRPCNHPLRGAHATTLCAACDKQHHPERLPQHSVGVSGLCAAALTAPAVVATGRAAIHPVDSRRSAPAVATGCERLTSRAPVAVARPCGGWGTAARCLAASQRVKARAVEGDFEHHDTRSTACAGAVGRAARICAVHAHKHTMGGHPVYFWHGLWKGLQLRTFCVTKKGEAATVIYDVLDEAGTRDA